MKYFVLGALASGFLLYGMSMMYGATGSLDITEVVQGHRQPARSTSQVLVFGLVFVVAGLAFKLGAVPFHMWVPDVYHGAPTAVTLLIGGAPEARRVRASRIRLLVEGHARRWRIDWQQMLVVLAVAVAGARQPDRHRADQPQAHAGLLDHLADGLHAARPDGRAWSTATRCRRGNAYSAAMFYIVTYVLTTLGTFGMILLLSRAGFEGEEIDDFAGLNQRSPWYRRRDGDAACSRWPACRRLVGFYAKLAVLQALVDHRPAATSWLAVVAVLLSLVGAFYYLRVVKVMYFDEPVDGHPVVGAGATCARCWRSTARWSCSSASLPGGLMALCAQAIVQGAGHLIGCACRRRASVWLVLAGRAGRRQPAVRQRARCSASVPLRAPHKSLGWRLARTGAAVLSLAVGVGLLLEAPHRPDRSRRAGSSTPSRRALFVTLRLSRLHLALPAQAPQ